MKNSFKRLLSIFLAVVMTIGIAPLSGFVGLELPKWLDFSEIFQVEAEAASYSGTCGDNISWSLDTETGLLEIKGTGAMYDYAYSSWAPWYDYGYDVKKISISSGVTTIGDYAFAITFVNLETVEIPYGIIDIGDYAFYSCANLSSINLPNSVKSIGNLAFSMCLKLTSVRIPGSVTYIGRNAFFGRVIEQFIVESTNTVYSSDSYGVLYNKNKTELVKYPEGNTRTSFTVPNTVKKIGVSAFIDCVNLSEIVLPECVEIIDTGAFVNCEALKEINLGSKIESVCDGAFMGCVALESITIPDSIESIGQMAFSGCEKIADVYFYGTEAEWEKIAIGEYNEPLLNAKIHFLGENVIASGTCGENLTWILYEDGLLEIKGTGAMTDFSYGKAPWASYVSNVKTIIILDGATSIGNYAFYGCKNLKTVEIADSVVSIGDGAFGKCEGLTSIEIPYGVKILGTGMCVDCISLKSITIPDSVTKIEINAFYETAYYNNPSNWESGVLYIGKYLIAANADLSGKYNIKSGTKTIADCAFYGCYDLTSVTIPGTVKNIGSSSFWGCTGLETITIGNGVARIDDNAFLGCIELASITIPNSVTSIGCDAFSNTGYSNDGSNWENNVLYISNCLIDVKSDISGSCSIKEGTKVISDEAFVGCGITEITIPNSVTNMGEALFTGCMDLTSVVIPEKVKTIGDKMFLCCPSLKYVHIPPTVTDIGVDVFNNDLYEDLYETALGKESRTNAYICSTSENCYAKAYAKENDIEFKLCSGHSNEDHTHSYTSKVTKQPTCTEAGVETFICSCGDTYTKPIPAKGHTIVVDNEVKATCTETGLTEGKHCSVCGVVLEKQNVVDALGHNWSEWTVTKAPTFFEEGIQTRKCSRCSATETEAIPKSEFDVSVLRLENATAVSTGNTIVITANENAEKVSVYPTTKDGETVAIEVSGTPIKVSKNGTFYLNFVEWHIAGNNVETTITIGDNEASAVTFNVKFIFPVINGGHTEKPCEDIKATCTEPGQTGGTYCEICGETVVEPTVIAALGHKAGAVVKENEVPATCTEKGSWDEVIYCTVCGEQLSRETKYTGSALGHKEVIDEAVAPTCTETGLTEGKRCSECDEVLVAQEETSALGHEEGEWEPDGENKEIKKCSRCGDVISARITDDESGIMVEYDLEQFKDKDVKIFAEQEEAKMDAQVIQLLNKGKYVVYDITMLVGDEPVHELGEDNYVIVKIPVPEGFDKSKTKVVYLNANSLKREYMEIVDCAEEGYIAFKTNHFSYYALVELKGNVEDIIVNDFAMNYKSTLSLENAVEIDFDGNPDYETTYSSSNTSVVAVDENGNVTAVGTGEAEITVTVTDEYGNAVEDTCTVTVSYAWWQWLIIIFLFGWIWY